MKNKYNMTLEENVFVAKRNIVDYIWKSAKLEGIDITYQATSIIFDGLVTKDVKVPDIVAVNNLKHAWQFILDTLEYPVDYNLICQINKIVGDNNIISRAGYIRNFPVSMGGTNWKPDMPIESQIKEDLKEILLKESATEKAIRLMLYCMRKQMFSDGNKRTSMLIANHIMISNGVGIISIPIDEQDKFRRLLVTFYETNNSEEITQFIYNKCIDGLDFNYQESLSKTNNLTFKGDVI